MRALKKVNHLILGFGHYYKIGSTKEIFLQLDVFIRERMRRFISQDIKKEILFGGGLTNQYLRKMGLKSLEDVKIAYDRSGKRKLYQKQRLSYIKTQAKTSKTGHKISRSLDHSISNSKLYQAQLMILDKFEEITSLVKEILKKLEKW